MNILRKFFSLFTFFVSSTFLLHANDIDPTEWNLSSWQIMANMGYGDSFEENIQDLDDILPKSASPMQPKWWGAFKKVHGTWKWKIDQFFVSNSADFKFQVYIASPRNKIYKSKVFSTTHLPTDYTIKIKNPVIGPYLVFVKLISVTNPGSVSFISSTKNNKNHSQYVSGNGISTDPELIGKKLIMGAFSIPK